MSNQDQQDLREGKVKKQGEKLWEKWREQMDMLEKSLVAKAKGGIDYYDAYALGCQLDQFEDYLNVCEDNGNTNQLGTLPTIGYNVITAVQGQSVLGAMAATQPIQEERGIVWYKTVRASTTKGSQTAQDVLVDPRSTIVTPQGYSSNFISGEVGANTGGAPGTAYAFTLAAVPVRSETLKITVQDDATVWCKDVGPAEGSDGTVGQLLGIGVSGSITYATGAVSLTFAAAPAASKDIYAEYQQNLELAADLPQIHTYYDSKSVMAYVYALKSVWGALQNYSMRKRFGSSIEQEAARDLVIEINRELAGDGIRKLLAAAQGNTTWYKTPPTAISYRDHKDTFMDSISDAEAIMIGNAGRGTISTMIVGRELAAVIQTLPGFTKLSDGTTMGSHIFGTLNGITIVRVNEQALLDSKIGIAIWRPSNPWEGALVYAPYMPLVTSDTIPLGPNPMSDQKFAAIWAALTVMNQNFVTKITLDLGAAP
jgi:hypothetical protein